MITLYVEHIIKEGHEKEAMAIVEMVTGYTRNKQGLIFRQVLRSQENPRKLNTIASWHSMEDFQNYRNSRPPRTQKDVDEEMKHFNVMTVEMFDVEDSLNL